MFSKISTSIASFLLLSVIIIAAVILINRISPKLNDNVSNSTSSLALRKIIIDPGHGGKDGGAVSVNGTLEKELNLDISVKLRDIIHILGYSTVLTRDSDTELTHPDGGTRKMQDLKGRLSVAEDNSDAVFVSIHMNKFPIEKYKGLQVYYSPNNKDSLTLATRIQDEVCAVLQNDNKRTIKKANSSIYLLDKITSPAVLVECGFLSNQYEANALDDPEYRLKLSVLIAKSICMWYNELEYAD